MQSRLQAARHGAETLKDKIKRQKNELVGIALRLVTRQAQDPLHENRMKKRTITLHDLKTYFRPSRRRSIEREEEHRKMEYQSTNLGRESYHPPQEESFVSDESRLLVVDNSPMTQWHPEPVSRICLYNDSKVTIFLACSPSVPGLLDSNELFEMTTKPVAIDGDNALSFMPPFASMWIESLNRPTTSLLLGINTDDFSATLRQWLTTKHRQTRLVSISGLRTLQIEPEDLSHERLQTLSCTWGAVLWDGKEQMTPCESNRFPGPDTTNLIVILICSCTKGVAMRLCEQPYIDLDPETYVAGRACF